MLLLGSSKGSTSLFGARVDYLAPAAMPPACLHPAGAAHAPRQCSKELGSLVEAVRYILTPRPDYYRIADRTSFGTCYSDVLQNAEQSFSTLCSFAFSTPGLCLLAFFLSLRGIPWCSFARDGLRSGAVIFHGRFWCN